MSSDIEITPVKTKKDLMTFIKLPWKIYKGDPNWVPPLISERRDFLTPGKNAELEFIDFQLFLAHKDGEVVGRISAHVNHRHNEFHGEKMGFFGFFETIRDYSVAEKLLQTAADWVRERGMTDLRGPACFSSNDDSYGLLVKGFDGPPVILMSYNPPYYSEFIERFGMEKAMDLYAFMLDASDKVGRPPEEVIPDKIRRVAELARKRYKITVRNPDMKKLNEEIHRFKEIYNKAWEKNWGFVPVTDAEVDSLADELVPILDPEVVFFAEVDGKPIGAILPLPNYNEVLIHMNGRLFPFGWAKFLWYKRKIELLRVFAMGVIKEYRNRGVDALMYYEMAKAALRRGYVRTEMSWTLETNVNVNNTIRNLGGEVYRIYRLYQMPV
jgi:GNAT superfamily N-acetyltransferase